MMKSIKQDELSKFNDSTFPEINRATKCYKDAQIE